MGVHEASLLSESPASQLLPKFLKELSLRVHCATTPTETPEKTASQMSLRHNSCGNSLKKLYLRTHCVTIPAEIPDKLSLRVPRATTPAEILAKTVSQIALHHNSMNFERRIPPHPKNSQLHRGGGPSWLAAWRGPLHHIRSPITRLKLLLKARCHMTLPKNQTALKLTLASHCVTSAFRSHH